MTAESGTTTRVSVLLGSENQPALVRWSTFWERPHHYDSYALMAPNGSPEGPVVIDPEALTSEGEERLLTLLGRSPAAIVLTNDMHERAAYALRERWNAPVWAPAYGAAEHGGEMEGQPDHLYQDGAALPGGLRAVKITGAFRGDTILTWSAPSGERVLFTGDALNAHFSADVPGGPHPRRGEPGLYVGAGPFYLEKFEPEAFKQSVRPLLNERIDLLCGAHGEPWSTAAGGTLRRLLDLDWAPFLAEKRHPMVS